MSSYRERLFRTLVIAGALTGPAFLGGCDEELQKPSENNTYNVHLYYGKDVSEHKYLGEVIGISRCKTAVHTRAAEMQLKPQTYTYVCCWVNAGEPCYQKHK